MDNPQTQAPTALTANAETFSRQDAIRFNQEYRGRLREKFRRLLQNRPQSRRHLLSLLCATHFSILVGRLVGDVVFNGGLHPTRLNALSVPSVVLALATRITWHALFVNPYAFLCYQRPSASYRRAVYVVSLVTTLPAVALHAAMIRVSAESRRRPFNLDFGTAILQLLLLLPAVALYVWMLYWYLLRHNEEHYEPTAPLPVPEGTTPSQMPEADSTAPVPALSRSGHLSEAYARQQTYRRFGSGDGHTSPTAETAAAFQTNAPNTPSPSEAQGRPPRPLRCRTIAWFDYKPRSWLSNPLIPLVLGAYSTLVACLVYMLVRENSLSKFPSPNAKCGFYAPLGVYLLCAYASKRFIRTSFFAKIQTSPPGPWIVVESLLGNPTFRNVEDGSTTGTDPRLRVVPLDRRDYVVKFNSVLPGCDEYWGHRGRKCITNFRSRPVIYRFALLGLASFLFAKGSICIFNYPTNTDEYDKRPDLTVPDLERQFRIFSLKLKLMIAIVPLVILVSWYAFFCGLQLWNLWMDAILKYAPAEMGLERQIQI